jgi:hypothetical protein
MYTWTYADLANAFPAELLLLPNDQTSQGLDLICLAADQATHECPEWPFWLLNTWELSDEQARDAQSMVESWSVVLYSIRTAARVNDFRLQATTQFGESRSRAFLEKSATNFYSIIDALLLSARLEARSGKTSVMDDVLNAISLGTQLCIGGGDTLVYLLGERTRKKVFPVITEALKADLSTEDGLFNLLGELDRSAACEGWLQSVLSDRIRDAIISFAEINKQLSDGHLCTEALNSLLTNLFSQANNSDESTLTTTDNRRQAICDGLDLNPFPFDVRRTVDLLNVLYVSHCRKFYERLPEQYEQIVNQQLLENAWPESFQFTSDLPPPTSSEIEAIKDRLRHAVNPLGTLLLRDITRTFDREINSGLALVWSSLIEIDTARIMVGGYLFKHRFGRFPIEIEQLCDTGILPNLPTDRLTGLPLTLSPDRTSILVTPRDAQDSDRIYGLDRESVLRKITLPVPW